MRSSNCRTALATSIVFSAFQHVDAIQLDLNRQSSIISAASTVTHSMMQWYTGNLTGQIPGLLPAPYYWWEGGSAMGALIDYWYYTGDPTYNEIVTQGLQFQSSPTKDFMPPNQTKDEGNDDQSFWGFAAMAAAEYGFPNPPPDEPQWLALAQGVWNSQQLRWDATTCGGGLRWQIFTWNDGYDYKNSPSNGGFINLGARLFAYTGNKTYADWTEKAWDWMTTVGLISDHDEGHGFSVYDGTYTTDNCSKIGDWVQWTYSAGMLMNAAAVMWNATQDHRWEARVNGLWSANKVFFTSQKILWEPACEARDTCDLDELSFKGYFVRFMAASIKWMPQLYEEFQPYIAATGSAAAAQCTGTIAGLNGNACGFTWIDNGQWDGTYGWGQQMDALQAIQANLIQEARSPVSAKTGGISHGNPSAGTTGDTSSTIEHLSHITTASKAGAGILTALVLIGWLGGTWWMLT